MGKVTVLYFASARDVVGKQRETIEFEDGATAGEVLDRVVREHPGLLRARKSIRLSVNQEVVNPSARVRDGDELGVLPPVAGG